VGKINCKLVGFTAKTGNTAQVKSGGKVNVNYIGFTTERQGRGNTAAKVWCTKFGKLLRSMVYGGGGKICKLV
jgi:hypothetical protein